MSTVTNATATKSVKTAPVAGVPAKKKRTVTRGPQNDLHGMIQGLYTFALPKHVNVEFARRRGLDESQAAVAIRGLIGKIGKGNGVLNKRSEEAVNTFIDVCIERVPSLSPQADEIKSRITYSTNKGGKKGKGSWMTSLLEGKVARMKDGKLYRLAELTEDAAKKICTESGQVFPDKKEVA